MLPYLAVYETAPVESLLDIYWETTSEGLIVDLNSAIAQGSGGAVGFTPLGWSMDESIQGGQYVTDFFEPIDREGNSIVTATEVVVVGSTDGNGNDAPLFEIYNGVGAQTGSYKLIYTGGGSTFISDSAELLVYNITIKVTTAQGDISELTVGGMPQGEGAVQNLTPSYTQFPDFQTTKDTTTIISAADWVAQTPVNGSADTSRNRLGLQYDFTGPANWSIDRRSGQITQNTPTPNGTYAVDLILYDASGLSVPGGTPPYGPMSVSHTTNITIGYPLVNPEAIGTCLISASPGDPSTINSNNNGQAISGIWYVVENEDNLNLEGLMPTAPAFRIGTGAHSSGTISFTYNVRQVGSLGKAVKTGSADFYYRIAGGDGTWLSMARSLEYNKAGISSDSYVTTPYYDNPGYTFAGGITLANTGSSDDTWFSGIRAMDYLDFGSFESIEYAVVVKNLEKTAGDNTNFVIGWVVSDDLHNPGCVPWQGVNPAPKPFYKYFRSPESNSTVNEQTIVESNILYAETPYGEYVNQFYTNEALSIPYTTTSGTNYINFRLDRTNTPLIGSKPWSTTSGNPVSNLTWSAGFSSDDGTRIQDTDLTNGVNSIQTTPAFDINEDAGTSRVYVNN